ncbi:MAG: putative metallopeptidase [Myxococcaceae bacterium]
MRLRRPHLSRVVQAFVRHVAQSLPEFSHLDAERILVVAGEARRASRGSVKPLAFREAKRKDARGNEKPVVKVSGKRMLYCITLRPLFFRGSSAAARIETVLHELFHISPRFDGTLHAGRRHAQLGLRFPKLLKPLVRRAIADCPPEIYDVFSHEGEVRVWQWLERPPPKLSPGVRPRRLYTEEQLFVGVVRMTHRARQTV